MKKLLALSLAILLLLPALAACQTNEPLDPYEPETSESEEPAVPELVIAKTGEQSQYTLIYAEALSGTVRTYAKNLATQINKIYPGCLLLESSDYASTEEAPTGTLEILVGNTNRPESRELTDSFTGQYQYGIRVFANGRVAIAATNDRLLQEAISYFLKTYISKDTDGVLSIPGTLNYLFDETVSGDREGWQLSVPAYMGGTVSASLYNTGPGITMDQASALGRMHVIAQTNRSDYDAYLTTLASKGYTQVSKTEQNGNVFAQYKHASNGKLVYAYLWAALGEVRIIEETGIAETDFEYTYTPAAGETTGIYQYAMMYNRNGHGNQVGDPYGNNGMFYIIRLADDKLILVDGGSKLQATDGATAELMNFMREITGKSNTEKVDIAAYVLSHAHGDHKGFMEKLVNDYADQINIERVMHNLPNWEYRNDFIALGQAIKTKFPSVKFLKAHSGQSIQLGNISIDIITTHEDIVSADTGKSNIIDFNSSTTVYRMNINGKTFMLMGDWGGGDTHAPADYTETERRLLAVYANGSASYLKSDIIQVAHHALNPYMENVNEAIAATYAFFPAADVTYAQQAHNVVRTNLDQITGAGCPTSRIFFASRYTYCLDIAQDGTITVAAQSIRGTDTGDDPDTLDTVEQNYVNVTLEAYDPYRNPTSQEFANWDLIH